MAERLIHGFGVFDTNEQPLHQFAVWLPPDVQIIILKRMN